MTGHEMTGMTVEVGIRGNTDRGNVFTLPRQVGYQI